MAATIANHCPRTALSRPAGHQAVVGQDWRQRKKMHRPCSKTATPSLYPNGRVHPPPAPLITCPWPRRRRSTSLRSVTQGLPRRKKGLADLAKPLVKLVEP